MALKKIEQICTKLRSQWPDVVNIAIYHRLGLVGIREASVVIAISSPHRKTSLEAVAVAIDELKKHVPIWKKEIYNEDESTWKENKECLIACGDKNIFFNDNMCEIENPHLLPNQLVQISAGENEINRRIQCFVEKKRDEIDFCNVMDYTDVKEIPPIKNSHQTNSDNQRDFDDDESTNETMTCARVNSVIIKQEYSKCHLKVKKVKNNVGPQIRPNYLNTLDKLMHAIQIEKSTDAHLHIPNKMESTMLKYPTIIERLENIEEHLNLPHSEIKNIYKRLKIIENRILYLESISPEYHHFLMDKSQINDNSNYFEAFNDMTPISELSSYKRKMYSVNEIETILKILEEQEVDNQKRKNGCSFLFFNYVVNLNLKGQ
ncbi:molybdenum cofactor synthesis 2B isoform 2-T2 [Cochliomyia hominivorax]